MQKHSTLNLLKVILSVWLVLIATGMPLYAQNASETKTIKESSYEEKLARWNSFSDEQKEAIRKRARTMSEKKFKQLENNYERIRSFEPVDQERVEENYGRMKQFKPQQQRVLKRKFERFQQLPQEQKQQFRRKFVEPRRHAPGFSQQQYQRQWQQPGSGHVPDPNKKPGFTPGQSPDRQPGQQPDRQPGQSGQSGHRPGQPGQRTGQRQWQQPGNGHVPDPNKKPGFMPGQPPDRQPGQPGQPGHRPGQPGQRPGQRQWQQPGNGHVPDPNKKPGFTPGQPGQLNDQNHQPQNPDFKPENGPQKMRPGMKHRHPVPRRDDLREFRRDMMGDNNNREGQEPLQKRWREIDNFREKSGNSDAPDQTIQSGDEKRTPGVHKVPPPRNGHFKPPMSPDNKPDPSRGGYKQNPDKILRKSDDGKMKRPLTDPSGKD
ncbi:MAG: DUF3106 domain-containing protein [Candidatus Riflebacteria bacterium]|nr:DUF3106 domain-containing protein [Candidatus Riflebacteria bacterium]